MTTLSSSAIRKWSEAGLFRQVDLGISVEDANRLAKRCWIEILSGKSASSVLAGLDDLPAVLYALGRFLQDSTEASSREGLSAAAALYKFTSEEHSFAGTDERHVLSAAFAYIAWRCARRIAILPEARTWEAKCEQHVIAPEDVGEYLRLSAKDQARTLASFLTDSATLLVACRQLRREGNRDPIRSLFPAIAMYRWVTTNWERADVEDRSFFAGEAASIVANCLRLGGRFRESGPWFHAATHWFSKTENPVPSLSRVELSFAAALYNHQQPEESRAHLANLSSIFNQYGMQDELHKCQLLEGMVLKELGKRTEAIAILSRLVNGPSVPEDPLVHGLGWTQLGDTIASVGSLEDAAKCIAAAIPLIEQAKVPWAIGDCKAVLGEIVRDQGKLKEAIVLFRSAIEISVACGLDARVAYLRVFLAESLMMSGREKEGAEEILVALPILSREGLAPAATAALQLLQESIRRQKSDPDAVRRLRTELQKMNERANS